MTIDPTTALDEYAAALRRFSALCAEPTTDVIALLDTTRDLARLGRARESLPERILLDIRTPIEGCLAFVRGGRCERDLRLMVSRVLLETYFGDA